MPPIGSPPLAGIRVLDLADASGAMGGRLLAALGADVVMAEPGGGHPMRSVGEAFFRFYAAGKRSIALEPGAPGAAMVRRLAGAADVLLTTGTAGPDAIPHHPGLVRANVSGARPGRRAADLLAQAAGGMLHGSGRAEGPPLQALGLQAYHQAGIFAAIGVVAALLARARTGRGGDVDVGLEAAAAAAVECPPPREGGEPPRRSGRLHSTRAFHVGRGRDGWVLLSTLGDWTTLVEWMKADGMAGELVGPEWADPDVRRRGAALLFARMEEWARRYEVEALAAAAQLRRLPFAAVRPPEALLRDEQLLARGFFVAGTSDRAPFPGPAFRLGPLPERFAYAPDLDQDRDEVRAAWTAAPSSATGAAAERGARPLDGVRVLDFTWLIAGPVATRVLADLGADVVKVRHPRTPEPERAAATWEADLDRGKRSIVLDLACAEGLALAKRLVRVADVVIDNFSARVMENLGLGYAALRALRPDVVCVRMTGFGTTGPHRDHVSFGPTLHARAGYTALMTDVPGIPVGFGWSYADFASGHLAALAVLSALWRRHRTGEGAMVDFSQLEALASLVGPLLLDRAADGAASEPIANRSQEGAAAPHGVYPCAGADRWLALSVGSEAEWRRFAAALGDPPWTRDPRFARARDRVRAAGALDLHVAAWSRTRDVGDAVACLERAGVPAAPVVAREDLRGGRPALCLADVSCSSRPGPAAGEHTREVLRELLALDDATLDRLESEGVVRGPRGALSGVAPAR